MAAPLRRPAPCSQLVTALMEARQAGLDFDDAWERAWRAIIWPHDTTHRRQWRVALRAGRIEYRAAYEGLPTRTSMLFRDLSLEMLFAPDPESDVDWPAAA